MSVRRMEKLVETLGISRLSKSWVSMMDKELDEHVASLRRRLLDAGPYTFVAADALVLKVREGGRVVGAHALLATDVNTDGHREILGLQVTSGENCAGWVALFRDFTARGLSGVQLVASGAHQGLVATTLPDAAAVQAQYDRVLDVLSGMLPAAAEHPDTARADVLAFTPFPKELWR